MFYYSVFKKYSNKQNKQNLFSRYYQPSKNSFATTIYKKSTANTYLL